MYMFNKFLASVFASTAYALLSTAGWKRRTVEANLAHVHESNILDNVTNLEQTSAHKNKHILYKLIIRNLARHVGEMIFTFDEYKTLPWHCSEYPVKKNDCIFEIADDSARAIDKMRKGGIFLTAHYGNYEASGAWLCALGVPLKASFIPLKPAWLNRIVYEKIRCVKGRPYSISAKTPREFLDQLDGKAPDCAGQKQLFCLLADQDCRIGSALDGTFLGKPAKINPLPDFLLKHRPDTPVFFCWIEERRDGSRDVSKKILHAVEATKFQPENARRSIVDGPYRKWLEERISENPALWYGWTHRRFRSKNPEIYL
ncbi:MAG: lysophospholipid acyltransferase family protein [Bacteroidales bacterium]|nr:lysophospholipid acyltransferase family protein [Bacteroidales bacterium]